MHNIQYFFSVEHIDCNTKHCLNELSSHMFVRQLKIAILINSPKNILIQEKKQEAYFMAQKDSAKIHGTTVKFTRSFI